MYAFMNQFLFTLCLCCPVDVSFTSVRIDTLSFLFHMLISF